MKPRMAGMIRAGLRPSSVMSVKATPAVSRLSSRRSQLILVGEVAMSTGSAWAWPPRRYLSMEARNSAAPR